MKSHEATSTELSSDSIRQAVDRLGPWFHNLHLPGNVQTVPDHFLGDFPRVLWRHIQQHVPNDLTGWRVLDIGCNAGFYSFELARRGALVLGIDVDEHYLKQARWACGMLQLNDRVRFEQMQVYELARMNEMFDLVWFMGVLYHLRYPLLGLDLVAAKVRRLLVFQSMRLPGEAVMDPPADIDINQREMMLDPGWSVMAFIEHRLARDPTNWWVPNHACILAMLRSAGMRVIQHVPPEVYICEPDDMLGPAYPIEAELRAATGQPWR